MALFDKILIANRGEIACRIIRTARKLKIKTVAVFSEVDSHALHVKLADEAYLIGPASSKDSYLNIEKIINVAMQTQVDAIHPGYGFLSENTHFAKACEAHGITFIGPSSSAIHIMGNKNVAKDLMQQHDVPILPGYFDHAQSLEDLLKAAKKIGFPIVLKAIAGGGGKGLRLVQDKKDFEQAYLAVKREASAFFNDDKLLIEKYLVNARHIEVQLLADHFGQVQTLSTRDCSIQRRHQKIIEEAPAPNIDSHLNEQILQAAIRAAKAINYTNAGTIEFLLTDNAFYFMEMNTRLQVEHPVTEMITGVDLVEWQIRIAAGEKLFQKPVKNIGHAIEARLNAEDPEKDFLPSSGHLHYFSFPEDMKQTRIDTGYQTGDQVGIYYDSLLAKLIVWDENRILAIARLQQLLSTTVVFGIKTNLPLLKAICQDQDFKLSNFSTHFLQEQKLAIVKHPNEQTLAICALFLLLLPQSASKKLLIDDPYSPWRKHDGWQLFFPNNLQYEFVIYNNKITVNIKLENSTYQVQINEHWLHCEARNIMQLENDIYQLDVLIANAYREAKIFKQESKLEVIIGDEFYTLSIADDNVEGVLHEQDEQLLAPMPGTIVALHVNTGQKVSKGDKLLVIEAMKMEHTVYAPRDGIIKECHYQIGDLIKEGSELIEFD